MLVSHGGVTVDGLRTLVGDEALAEVCPDATIGVPAAGLTRLTVTSHESRVLYVGWTEHLC